MKRLREIITNPIGIAIAFVHWIVVVFTLSFDDVQRFKKAISMHGGESLAYQLLEYINFFPLLIVVVVFTPISHSFEKNLFLELLAFLLFFICSNFQWLLIGYFISRFASSHRELEKIKFSLKNE